MNTTKMMAFINYNEIFFLVYRSRVTVDDRKVFEKNSVRKQGL